ncbi:MAG: hypothetical protein IPK83_00830 [Planctomycetes bacterium]|nr:hypothetical protein [Planctomycetota bacterium]
MSIWTGAVVAVAAMAGVEIAADSFTRAALAERAGAVAIRTIGSVRITGIDSATGLGWTAAALMLVVVARRALSPRKLVADAAQVESIAVSHLHWHQLRRSSSISYRSGGLYGP